MLREILYALHILGMTALILITLFLIVKKDIPQELKKKLAIYLLSASHTQFLSGLALFFLLFSQVNQIKIGIKMLLAVGVAVAATLYNKKTKRNEAQNSSLLYIILSIVIIITVIAFRV